VTWRRPPLPQDRDRRAFRKGSRVRAYWTFHKGCPPGPEKIERGTCGTVTGPAVIRPDVFGHVRMIPVRWDNGLSGEVSDRLLELETE